jgi:hypothetical protein
MVGYWSVDPHGGLAQALLLLEGPTSGGELNDP